MLHFEEALLLGSVVHSSSRTWACSFLHYGGICNDTVQVVRLSMGIDARINILVCRLGQPLMAEPSIIQTNDVVGVISSCTQ
jgi:hypothetical protein